MFMAGYSWAGLMPETALATAITRGLLVQQDTTSMDSWNDDETNGNNKLPNMLLYETLRLQQNVLRVFQQ